jgi:hypothetical protein
MLAGHYSQDAPAVKSGIYQVFIMFSSEARRQSAGNTYLGLSLAGHFQFLLYRFSPRRAKNDTE